MRKKLIYILALVLILFLVLSGCSETIDDGTKNSNIYKISGKVVDENGDGIKGITLNFSNCDETVMTDEDGNWTKNNLKGKVKITPVKEEVITFEPENLTVLEEQDNIIFQVLLLEKDYDEIKTASNDIDKKVEEEYDPSNKKESLQNIAEEVDDLPEVEKTIGDQAGLFVKFKKGGSIFWESDKMIPLEGEVNDLSKKSMEIMDHKGIFLQSKVGNNKGIIINSLSEDEDYENVKPYLDEIETMLEKAGYDIKRKNGIEADIELFKNLDEYGFIFMFGHGNTDPLGRNLIYFQTGEEASWADEMKEIVAPDFVRNRISIKDGKLAITNRFIEKYNSEFKDSFVVSFSCHGLEEKHMARAFVENGSQAYLGWTERTGVELIDSKIDVLDNMVAGYTLKEAYNQLDESQKEIKVSVDGEEFVTSLRYYPEDATDVRLVKEMYKLEINKIGEGKVKVEPDQDKFEKGKEVKIEAIPSIGWEFDYWEGDVVNNESAQTTIIINEDKIVKAHFENEEAVTEEWSFTGHIKPVNEIAVDEGYVYSVGNDDMLRKISPEGEELWKRNLESAYHVSVSSKGNVFVTDTEMVRKFSPDGEERWNCEVPFSQAMTVDKDENIYIGVTDYSTWEHKIMKILKDGTVSLVAETSVGVSTIDVDSDNNIYIGTSYIAGNDTLMKFSPEGKVVWGFDGHLSPVKDVKVDSNGYVYSCSTDCTVRKISPQGEEIWSFDGHSPGYVYSLDVDDEGYVYSGGGRGEYRDEYDYTLRKISPTGEEIWSYDAEDDHHHNDVKSVVVDSAGNVYYGSSNGTIRKLSQNSQ